MGGCILQTNSTCLPVVSWGFARRLLGASPLWTCAWLVANADRCRLGAVYGVGATWLLEARDTRGRERTPRLGNLGAGFSAVTSDLLWLRYCCARRIFHLDQDGRLRRTVHIAAVPLVSPHTLLRTSPTLDFPPASTHELSTCMYVESLLLSLV